MIKIDKKTDASFTIDGVPYEGSYEVRADKGIGENMRIISVTANSFGVI